MTYSPELFHRVMMAVSGSCRIVIVSMRVDYCMRVHMPVMEMRVGLYVSEFVYRFNVKKTYAIS